jgi:two-component SAPR family response regulator
MGQLTNLQAIRLYKSIESSIGKAAAEDFAKKLPLSKSATFERKFKWAEDVCRYLENTYSSENIKKIRMDCTCGPSEKQMVDARTLYLSSKNLAEFAEKYSNDNHSLWCEDEALYFSYPRCYCSCVKRMNKPLPGAWCMCTLGYTKRLFDYALNCETSVELIESVKTGSNRCVIKIMKEEKKGE